MGKSSVLRYFRDLLPSDRVAYVEFDAWRYDAASLRRQLLQDVATQLQDHEKLKANLSASGSTRASGLSVLTPIASAR